MSITRGPQPASFSYFRFNPDVHVQEKPYEILINLPSAVENSSGYRRSNQEFELQKIVVDDVRGHEQDFSLDRHGVCWTTWDGPQGWKGITAAEVQKMGKDSLENGYLRDVEEFIKDHLLHSAGETVDAVKVFDYKLRLSMDENDFSKRIIDLSDGLDPIIPVTHPHVDQSFQGAIQRVQYHMGDKASELLKRRFRIINLWRPLKLIKSWPLAICDSRSVLQEDLIASDLVRRKFLGETFYSKFNPNHKWYYLSDQQPDEVTMLKIHDSKMDADVRFCLHSSFQLPRVGTDEVRESFEVRALVFDHDDG